MREKINNLQSGLRVLIGVGIFGLVIVEMLFIATPIQIRFGMIGVLITEILFVIFSIIIGALLYGKEWNKRILPIKLPKIKELFATILIWLGSYLFVMLSTATLAYLFPEGFMHVSGGMNEVISSVPVWARVLIVAVSPAICEEILHRGLICSFMDKIHSKALVILIMGFIFGVFHLDIYRFLPTAILGASLTYIFLQTKNILLPMFFHFIHNFSSVLSTMSSDSANEEIYDTLYQIDNWKDIYSVTIGVFMILSVAVPWLLLGGHLLIREKNKNSAPKRVAPLIIVASIISFLFFVIGIIILIIAIQNMDINSLYIE